MKQTLTRYPGYTFTAGEVISPTGRKLKLSPTGRYGLRTVGGTRTSVSRSSILKQLGEVLELPNGSLVVPNTNDQYYISKEGRVFSFNKILNPQGIELAQTLNTKGYLVVSITFIEGTRPIEVHNLMAKTFIQADYAEQGLCCMHLDNIKINNKITNLKVGTYSENNKASYGDGLNPGNGYKTG